MILFVLNFLALLYLGVVGVGYGIYLWLCADAKYIGVAPPALKPHPWTLPLVLASLVWLLIQWGLSWQ